MKIHPMQLTIRELFAGFKDSGDAGVVGFGGRLDIRPPYQREFVYKDDKRNKVIDTVLKGYPLNVMYWVRNPDPDAPSDDTRATYEVLDGQQRTLSICKYVAGDFSILEDERPLYFHSLPVDVQERIRSYELTVYVCEGHDSEKLEWFRTINIAGEKLTDQELRNAVYTGPWLADAKRHFSRPSCPAFEIASDYVTGSPIRQELLELALKWISNDDPAGYMAAHQHDKTAIELWNYFNSVINWAKATFPTVRKEMKSVNWGELYDAHKGDKLDPAALEADIERFMLDDDVTRKAGIYPYVLNGKERNLSLRAFSEKVKRETHTKQKGLCANKKSCPEKGRKLKLEEMEADHITPWHAGGTTTASNCQMLCKECNRRKGGV